MLRTSNRLPLHLRPIDTRIQLFIDQPTNHDIIASYQVYSVRLFSRRVFIVRRSDNALNGVLENEIRNVIAADERAGECASVDGYDQDFFCERAGGVSTVSGL